MGCASSTPMVQTAGSEMLKAASHVATDATNTAEEAIEGIKGSVGKTLETAKDSVATTVESVKHDVENVVKEKAEMMEDAKNSLMEKFNLKQNENEGNQKNTNKDGENIVKTETDTVKTQLNDRMQHHSTGNSDGLMAENAAVKEIKEHILTRTDTETDSLKTSTPEPEIELALSKSHANQEDEEDDNPPTPKPTLSELENLTAELLKQQHEGTTVVNDTKTATTTPTTNEPVRSVMHENIKTLDKDNNTTKDNELIKTTTTTTALAINDVKSNIVHKTAQISTAVPAKALQTLTHGKKPQPLLPQTLTAKKAAAPAALSKDANKKRKTQPPAPPPSALALQEVAAGGKLKKNEDIENEDKMAANTVEEKRPNTTEWEKFADMLAQIRKYNPQDAFRRNGTLTKLGTAGIGHLRDRSVLGQHMRNAMDDEGSDTNCNMRGSPLFNSQRSSAQTASRAQHVTTRPNTGNNRTNHHEIAAHNGDGGAGGGGTYAYKSSRSTAGRKFDFNPTRSRINNDFVSSTSPPPSALQLSLQTTIPTQMPYAPYSHTNECIKSPTHTRSHHSHSEMISLPPLENLKRTSSRSQQDHQQQHLRHNHISPGFDHNNDLHNDFYDSETFPLTRQSSHNSLFSNSSLEDHYLSNFKSSARLQPMHHPPPVQKNTSSFLTTPRCSTFGLTKSYTDLYFITTSNKENKTKVPVNKGKMRKQ